MASEAMYLGVEARVDEVESLSESTLVKLSVETGEAKQTPAVRLVCKTEARTNVKVGDRVWVTVDAARTQLFDGVTGENLLLME
jgi:ABC-type sugar transport system ATPase subunit